MRRLQHEAQRQVARYSALAGEAALTAHAHEQALAHFQLALAAKGDQTIDDETAELCFGLGRAQLATLAPHELEPAVTSLGRAFEHYAQAGDVARAVAVVAYPLPLSLGMAQTKMPELIARGLTLVPRDSLEEGRLLVWHGWFSVFTDADYEAAQRAFQRVLIAERKDDAALTSPPPQRTPRCVTEFLHPTGRALSERHRSSPLNFPPARLERQLSPSLRA